jgi:tRNA-dihydrouridine synthase 1
MAGWKVVAPLVHHSDLAFRLLARQYGADVAFTEMIHAAEFLRRPHMRRSVLQTSPLDTPLVVQVHRFVF